ncbi:MBL fold metallo-hydrolase [Microvirga zambiensis]|uniref:MBL fold metallo-hydrolase n=1 Tax=Microvirga zambiensis TaxID=1402137 RepID=UPI00191F8B02|nr:MBL fold metallo-hydrolase [Microvirga zambiensis]
MRKSEPTKSILTRRHVLLGTSSLAVMPLLSGHAFAAPVSTFKQGDFDIIVVSDGFLTLPISIVAPEAAPLEQTDIIRRLGGNADTVQPRANIPLIRVGQDLILVDTGSGDKFQPTAGRLTANLAAVGVDPASVTKVVCTHAHPDHIGGTLAPGAGLTFPNATYFVSEAEWQFWTDPNYRTTMPDALHELARGSQRDLSAFKGRVNLVKPGEDIVAGMRVLGTAGHTPGHISLELAGGEGLIITGDAVTNHIVSFEYPGQKFGFDMQHDVAIANRKALLDRAANDKIKLLGFHWSDPGVGYAERKDNAYRFVPAI